MRSTLLATLTLLAAPIALAPTASAAADPCVEYYVADYHWYYTCVDPKGGTCAVYTQERHGMTWTPKKCLVEVDPLAIDAETKCVPTSGGMDYHSYLCVQPSNPRCAVYTESSTDWGTVRRCYGLV